MRIFNGFSANAAARCAMSGPASFPHTEKYPELPQQLTTLQRRHNLPAGWDKELSAYPADPKGQATRDSSGKVLNAIAKHVPWLMGGSADLAPSTKTRLTFDGAGDFADGSYDARNFHSACASMSWRRSSTVCRCAACARLRFRIPHITRRGTARPAIRLGAIMEIPAIHVFTHDSIGVGEDGPTHQPVEQLASLRAIPGLITLRPGDANEVIEAWRVIMALKHEPVALALTRRAWSLDGRSMARWPDWLKALTFWLTRRPAAGDLDRHWQRSLFVRRSLRAAQKRRHSSARRQHAVMGIVRTPRARNIANRFCLRRSRRALPSSKAWPWAGQNM